MSGENRDARVEPGIGRSLEAAREGKGLSLWQVEQETRIRSRYLRNLEREDFDVLPAVYVLGSLKTYADFLGLDGAALSRQLKARLVEPAAEPDLPARLAALGGTQDKKDGYEAAPVPAVGFDQLFLGMGVILISIFAIMTLAATVARGDGSPVSQINQPATPETPSEIALSGSVQDEEDGVEGGESSTAGNREDRPEDGPEAPKNDEDGKAQNDGKTKGDGRDPSKPRAASPFDGVEFVPMPPSSFPKASASSAPSSASPAPSSPAPSSPAPSSPAPSSSAPTATEPDDNLSSPAPATAGASPEPAADPAPSGGAGGSSPRSPADTDQISAEVDRRIGEAFQKSGIVR